MPTFSGCYRLTGWNMESGSVIIDLNANPPIHTCLGIG
jgi:hypothetical protein